MTKLPFFALVMARSVFLPQRFGVLTVIVEDKVQPRFIHQEGVTEVITTVIHGTLALWYMSVPINFAFSINTQDNNVIVIVVIVGRGRSTRGLQLVCTRIS